MWPGWKSILMLVSLGLFVWATWPVPAETQLLSYSQTLSNNVVPTRTLRARSESSTNDTAGVSLSEPQPERQLDWQVSPTEDGWRLTFLGRVGRHYQVEQSSDLTGPWQTITAPLPCVETPLTKAVHDSSGQVARFRPLSVEVMDPAGRLPARCFWRVVEMPNVGGLPLLNPLSGITSNTNQ